MNAAGRPVGRSIRLLAALAAAAALVPLFLCAVIGIYYDPQTTDDRILQGELLSAAVAIAFLVWLLVRLGLTGRLPARRIRIVAIAAAIWLVLVTAFFFFGPIETG